MKHLISLVAILLITGCKVTLDPAGPYQGDRVLYNADNTIVSANAVFQTFMKWEYDNREALAKWPDVKKAADKIRKGNKLWLETAIKARDNYKLLRNSTTETALEDAVKVLTDMILDANKYLKP